MIMNHFGYFKQNVTLHLFLHRVTPLVRSCNKRISSFAYYVRLDPNPRRSVQTSEIFSRFTPAHISTIQQNLKVNYVAI